MAIKTRSYSVDGKREMTIDEFKRRIKKFDEDKDGRISRDKLADAIRASGGWFARRKSKQGIRSVDTNGNGFIDDNELKRRVCRKALKCENFVFLKVSIRVTSLLFLCSCLICSCLLKC
ncbi:hypothetical protein DITRI_Ditri10aG0040200 [Diplodiscus trichospermus]